MGVLHTIFIFATSVNLKLFPNEEIYFLKSQSRKYSVARKTLTPSLYVSVRHSPFSGGLLINVF